MKRTFLVVFLMVGSAVAATSQDRGVGLGVILGEPTGISGKGWVSEANAFDLGVAWSFRHKGFFHVHSDYLWHFKDVFKSTERFVLYSGIGARLGVGKGDGIFGIRVVGGIAYWPHRAPIDVFLEIAPILDLAPATELTANGGIGIRYFFQ